MDLHGLDADAEALGDLPGRVAKAEKAENLQLPLAEEREIDLIGRYAVAGGLGSLADVGAAIEDVADGGADFAGGLPLDDVAGRARPERAAGVKGESCIERTMIPTRGRRSLISAMRSNPEQSLSEISTTATSGRFFSIASMHPSRPSDWPQTIRSACWFITLASHSRTSG